MNLQSFDHKDRKILIVATFLLFCSTSVFLTFDGFILPLLYKADSTSEKVATVIKTKNDVRRRSSTTFSWSSISDSKPIFKGDTIFTGDGSEAIIKNENGDQIVIAPNSLVVLNTEKESLSIDIAFGSIESRVQKGQKIIVSAKNKVTELKGANSVVKIDAGAGDKLLLNVISGRVEATNAGVKKILSKDEMSEVAEGVQEPTLAKIKLLSPLTDQRFKYSNNTSVEFQWKSEKKLPRAFLKVATNKSLKDPLIEIPVQGSSHIAFSLPADQKLYWKIIAEGAESDVSEFWIIGDEPPTPLLPKSGDELLYLAESGGEAIGYNTELSWDGGSPARKYQVLLSQSIEFKSVLKDIRTSAKNVALGKLPMGNYFWKVRSLEYKNSPWSSISQFSVLPKPSKILGLPLILSSSEHLLETKSHTYTLKDFRSLSAKAMRPLVANPPIIEWSKIKNAESYGVVISKDLSKVNQSRFVTVTDSKYKISNFEPGTYYYKIKSMGRGYFDSKFTDIQKINIEVHAPLATSSSVINEEITDPELLDLPPAPFNISWSSTVFTKQYSVEFSSDSSFKNAKRFITTNLNQQIQVSKPGLYYWRVTSLDERLNTISKASPTYSITYQRIFRNPAAATTLTSLFPKPNQVIVFVGNGKTELVFDWNEPVVTAKYEIQIAEDEFFNKIIHSAKVSDSNYIYKQPFEVNTVYWRIRDHSSTEWTTPKMFTVRYERKPFDFETSEMIQASRLRAIERQNNLLRMMRSKALAKKLNQRRQERQPAEAKTKSTRSEAESKASR